MAVGSGGCIARQREPPSVRLAWVWLVNDRDREQNVRVTVEDGDEVAFEEEYLLGTGPNDGNVRIESPVEAPGRYVVRMTAGEERVEVDTTDLVSDEANCVGLRFTLLDNGSTDWWHRAMQEC